MIQTSSVKPLLRPLLLVQRLSKTSNAITGEIEDAIRLCQNHFNSTALGLIYCTCLQFLQTAGDFVASENYLKKRYLEPRHEGALLLLPIAKRRVT